MYKNLGREVFFTTAFATFVCCWNALVGGYTDLVGVEHGPLIEAAWLLKIGLPLTPFTLASPSLGLLLGTCVIDFCFCNSICARRPCTTGASLGFFFFTLWLEWIETISMQI